MARLNGINGKKIALDTVVFIYTLEGNFEFGDRARGIFEEIEQNRCQGYASDLVLAELMIEPLREGKPDIAEEYASELPNFPNLTFLSPTRDIIISAAKLRGKTNLKLIDALYLATAIETECQIFITNDAGMKCDVSTIDIWLLSDLIL